MQTPYTCRLLGCRGLRWLALLLLGWALSALPPQPLAAQPATRLRELPVPQQLAPWIPWALGDSPELVCPVRDGSPLCLWPSRLALDLQPQTGTFSVELWLDRDGLVPLPGGDASWPVDVVADGRPVAVVAQAERPTCELKAGKHRVQGQFRWSHLPQSLRVPPEYAQVALKLRNKPIEQPKRDDQGSLWLQAHGAGEEQPQLELRVTRALHDGVPPQLVTQLRVRVAGAAREVDLGQVLPEGAVPMAISAELPARLDATGRLRLQVRAGSFEVRISARFIGMPERIRPGAHAPPWPSQEVWVVQADERLRQVELSGARAVDPAQVELDETFRGLPTFLVQTSSQDNAQDGLTLKTVRRGDPEPVPDEVNLSRRLWLDQDGAGYSVQDELSGALHTSTRLDLLSFPLGRVAVDGRDQLITRVAGAGAGAVAVAKDAPTGVELRNTALALQADYRIEQATRDLPAVGWSSDVRSLAVTLNLPPGYQLLGAGGVDQVDSSWLSDWDLFGFFYVLIVALGAGKVAGRWFGVVAFAALAISYQEPDAPSAAWLALIACVALLRHLNGPMAQRIARSLTGATVLWLVLQGLPFATRSLREAIYPQLAFAGASDAMLDMDRSAQAPASEPTPEAAPSPREAAASTASKVAEELAGAVGDSYSPYGADTLEKGRAPARKLGPEDPESVVQTGPGLPDWQWRTYRLTWSGPVQRDHRFSLWIAEPWLTRSVAVLRVLLLGLLALGLFRAAPRPGAGGPPLTAAGASLLCLALAAAASPARAQFPDPALLGELRVRMVRTPECRPNCLTLSELTLRVDASGLVLEGLVHALDATSVRLPGPAATWLPEQVTLDGADAALRVHTDGFVHARVAPGLHKLILKGKLPAQDVLTLRLGDRPTQVTVQADGYEVQGVREDGSVGDSLELKRLLRAAEGPEAAAEAVTLPAWITVTRELNLAYTFQATTIVKRETPLGGALVVHVPLLEGESVHDARVQVNGSEAIVPLTPDETELRFSSSLTQRDTIALEAARADRYSEVWKLRCGTTWQCEATGLAPTSRESDNQAQWVFYPWPTERLSIALRRPQPAEGRTLTIDSAHYRIVPGIRQSDASLTLRVRASRAGTQHVELPEGARVRSLTMNGATRPVHNAGRALQFNLQPGSTEVQLAFELESGLDRIYTPAPLVVDAPITNARVSLLPPRDAWLLWLSGPAWGPAILFWGYLVLCLLAAVLLARVRAIPLRRHEWLLLAAGLTQVSSAEAVIVVGFFFAFAWRRRLTELKPLWHDLMQLALVALTLTAASALFDAVRHGLLVQPDMQVAGLTSYSGELVWYEDRTSGALPQVTLVTLPLWVYRALMLLWALWLASRLLRWVPWAFDAFGEGGIWKRRPKRPTPPPPPPAASKTPTTPAQPLG